MIPNDVESPLRRILSDIMDPREFNQLIELNQLAISQGELSPVQVVVLQYLHKVSYAGMQSSGNKTVL